jgi:hypothetical protein
MERLKRLKDNGHGRYDEIQDEKLVLQTTMFVRSSHDAPQYSLQLDSEERLCVIHFYMPNFKRCTIMDKHLAVR